MAATSELDRVSMIVLRYMRRPIFVLILVYAVGITGMALIPGKSADGDTEFMSLFHAFYFFTYTATTTGFGEIPSEFTDEQRLWAVFCLYMGVIAWLYAIGSIIGLIRNTHFVQALSEYRFSKVVKQISEPFFIICGFGDTGSLLARGLSDHHFVGVIIDRDPERIKALSLRDYNIKMPGLCGDSSAPRHLVDAGVKHPQCKAVIALTGDEDVNLKIAVMARFMNPDVHIICRSTSPKHEEHLAPLHNVTIINPFEIFAQLLSMAITAPRLHNLNSWLVRAKGVRLGRPLKAPGDNWILCGYGRMGKWLRQYMKLNAIEPLVIDPNLDKDQETSCFIKGYADHGTLERAGLTNARGIVAGTDSDSDNLNIMMSAQVVNPTVFTIVRQNHHENQLAFDSARADLIVQTSLTTGRRILKHLISPQIQQLIDYLYEQGEHITGEVSEQLSSIIGDNKPHLWCVTLDRPHALAAADLFQQGCKLVLRNLLRHPSDRDESLACMPLVIIRDGQSRMLPSLNEMVFMDDCILLCGTEKSEQLLGSTLNNSYTLHYLITGEEKARGYFFLLLEEKRERSQNRST
ncbi:MAG: NAD-binding protein [Candidatus Thiodiazotropha sp. (ex Monitilora ramsayi)]|nr:NAD-binding protein [Candidatus Thiodiazotropha sp. (ex Monitilora ramsayi)]